MRLPPILSVALCALAVGSLAFYVDLHNDEVQPAALILVVGAGVIGAVWPRWSWAGGLISGLCILGGHVIYRAMGGTPAFAIEPNAWGALIAVVPATLGALMGAGVRVMLSPGSARSG